jgi:hypothetical protein
MGEESVITHPAPQLRPAQRKKIATDHAKLIARASGKVVDLGISDYEP